MDTYNYTCMVCDIENLSLLEFNRWSMQTSVDICAV